ncbi:MAG: cation diffusion facilitator family transporter [Planctomycetes bacterium]|nr:cation diffusion facilitator family transporter [Planctomycetota bacterium]
MTDEAHLCELRAAQRVAIVSLVGAAIITAAKFGVFGMTHSAAVLSDAMESVVNIVAAAMAAFSTWYASQPADREHPYGHGNIEFISVGVEGTMIVVAGLIIVFESTRRLWFGLAPEALDAGMGALAIVNIAMFGLALYVKRHGRTYDSPTLRADGTHLMIDCLTTLVIIASLAAVRFTGWVWLDAVTGIVMAIYVTVSGLRLMRQSLAGLMDEADLEEEAAMRQLLDDAVEAGEILSYHKLRHRHVGAFHWVDLHLQLPAEMTVVKAHSIASEIEGRIEDCLGRANATAHIEPPLGHRENAQENG